MEVKAASTLELKKFGLLVGAVFVVAFSLLPAVFKEHHPVRIWPLVVGFGLIGFALVAPNALSKIHSVWMTVGHYLGMINTTIILFLMYVTLFVPVGIFRKIFFKWDPLRVRAYKDPKVSSYFVRATGGTGSRLRYERPF